MTQIAKTDTEITRSQLELDSLKSGIERVLKFHRNARTSLSLPNAGIEAFGTVISHDSNSSGGDILHFIDYTKDMNLEGRIEKSQGKIKDELKRYRRRLGFLVIDAMGHSYAASLEAAIILNSMLPAMQGELSYYGKITPNLFRHVASSLGRNEEGYRPSTILYGETTHIPGENVATLKIIRRGHPAPVVWRHSTKNLDESLAQKWRETGETPVGIKLDGEMQTTRYHIDKTTLLPGDMVFPYSDGIMEYDGFKEKLEETLRRSHEEPVEELTTSIIQNILGKEQYDDVTIGVIRYSEDNRGKQN